MNGWYGRDGANTGASDSGVPGTGSEGGPVPALFVQETVTKYCTPFSRFEITADSSPDEVTAVASGLEFDVERGPG